MERAIFIGERSDGLAAIGMLVSGCGAEQQGWARGREGGQGGRTLGLPAGRPSAQPITSVSRPDAPLSGSAPPPQPLSLPQRDLDEWERRLETSATVWRSKGRPQQRGPRSDISVVWAARAPLLETWLHPSQCKETLFPTCSEVFIKSHNLCPQNLHLFCAKLKTGSAVLHCLTRACCEGYCVIVNNAPLCLECFSGPTDANIFVFWFRALLFIIRPHKKSRELKEQKKTKTGKQKVQQLKKNRKPKQENKAVKQSQYLFPVHFHSHLYFIAPKRFLVLVKVTLYPGRLCSFWMTVREPRGCTRNRSVLIWWKPGLLKDVHSSSKTWNTGVWKLK